MKERELGIWEASSSPMNINLEGNLFEIERAVSTCKRNT